MRLGELVLVGSVLLAACSFGGGPSDYEVLSVGEEPAIVGNYGSNPIRGTRYVVRYHLFGETQEWSALARDDEPICFASAKVGGDLPVTCYRGDDKAGDALREALDDVPLRQP
jgi:hypothetical protein